MTTTISKGGQISVPAPVRRRWGTSRVSLHDLGDRLIVRPIPDDPIGAALGSITLPAGMSSDSLREQARREDTEIEDRKTRDR